MAVSQADDGDCLLSPERAAQPQLVADAQVAMRFTALAIDLDFSSKARLLRLGARPIQARHVEPDVEANGCRGPSSLDSAYDGSHLRKLTTMLGIDTYRELFALIGCVFVVWLLIVTLFAPHIPYKLHERLDCTSKQFIHSLSNVTLSSVHHDSHFDVLTNGGAVLSGDARARSRRRSTRSTWNATSSGRTRRGARS